MINKFPKQLAIFCLSLFVLHSQTFAASTHGVAMHGEPKYKAGFTHFDYVNPEAPKGGTLKRATISGSGFDTFNQFVSKGVPATGIGFMYDTLTESSRDEAFSQYGLLAKNITMPEDRSSVTFHLNTKARFHDGKPVTAADVVFSLNTLKEKGAPHYRFYYRDIVKAEALTTHQVKFTFKDDKNKELALIIGQLPILPKHYWEKRNFESANLDIPVGSGPYKIKSFEAGRFVIYERVKDYWGKDLAVNKGRYNFDILQFDYYRDVTVALQALIAGQYDLRQENSSKTWATSYEVDNVKNGLIQKTVIEHQNPTGMQGFVLNTRKAVFKDPKVRQALAYLFDFEWTNNALMFNTYSRTQSYFSNSELASSGLPSAAELKLLTPFKDQLPEEVFTKTYRAPSTLAPSSFRSNLRSSLALLKEAGWQLKDKKLTHIKTGEVMKFEILLLGPTFERHVQPLIKNLQRVGIDASLRSLSDTQQYVNRLRKFDYDVMIHTFGQSLSPGNEQRDYWHSGAATTDDSRNYAGIQSPVVDHLVQAVINAKDRESLVVATQALDRVLLWGHYVIPQWHYPYYRLVYWDKFSRPDVQSKYSLSLDAWWLDTAKAKKLKK